MRRALLVGLCLFVALNAFGGGVYGMTGARGVPTTWLDGSPFATYRLPSLVLFVVVGGAFLEAAIAVYLRAPRARVAVFGAGAIALGWLAAELAILGYVSWLQPATAAAALAVIALAPPRRVHEPVWR